MDKCPKCSTWTLVYYPTKEQYVCSTCGKVIDLPYDQYLKKENVGPDLVRPLVRRTTIEDIS